MLVQPRLDGIVVAVVMRELGLWAEHNLLSKQYTTIVPSVWVSILTNVTQSCVPLMSIAFLTCFFSIPLDVFTKGTRPLLNTKLDT